MNKFKTAALASVFALVAGGAFAADFGATVGVDVIENTEGDFAATPTLDLSFGNDPEAVAFGGGTVTSEDGALVVDEWFIGANLGATRLSFGDQGDLFDFGGLEAVGGETLASPADEHESVIVTYGAVAGLVGFTDVGSDIGEIENVQLSYTTAVSSVDLVGAVDYNLNTEDFIVALDAAAPVNDRLFAGGTLTYADLFAYEGRVGYTITDTVVVAGYLNGDEDDMAQNLGAGVAYLEGGVEAYAEVGYNLDSDEATPAVGVSFSF